ncbi:unnamed protein product [Ascophyllum nodosum]
MEAESKIAKMDAEIKERHRRELEAAGPEASETIPDPARAGGDGHDGEGSAGSGTGNGVDEADVSKAAAALASASLEDQERDRRDQKKTKAQRKREKQREKARDLERERRIEREKAEGGPDPRIVEMEALGAQVAPRGLRVSEIKADGHCLYRAVAEQLSLSGRRPELTEESYLLMRQEAARELRSSPEDYLPFLPFLEGVEKGEAFEQYCQNVEGSAEWGGQVELQALSKALRVPMEVLSAVSPPLLMGENYDGSPLRLTYHEHYYALGAHYNSVVPS